MGERVGVEKSGQGTKQFPTEIGIAFKCFHNKLISIKHEKRF